MRHLCYFLCFRRSLTHKRKIRWNHPTGGLVMQPDRIVNGMPVSDFALAADVFEDLYHCGPDEELIIAEVFNRKEQRLARKMHRQFEAEMQEFADLMNCS